MEKIIYANAVYTGGGIYFLYGKCADGAHFFADPDYAEVSFCDVDAYSYFFPEDDDTWLTMAFYDEHHVIGTLEGKEATAFLFDVVLFICQNMPDGNYQTHDLVRCMERLVLPD